MIDRQLLRVLDELEDKESILVSWGFVNGGFSELEVSNLIQDSLCLDDEQAHQVLRDLLQHKLIFRFPGSASETLYRTRFAETLRLVWNMRQAFRDTDLDQGPRLVSDYRIAIRPRLYPRRDISVSEVVSSLEQARNLTEVERRAVKALMFSSNGEELRLSRFQLESTTNIFGSTGSSQTSATIVCAGTGTGKTLAFYLPGLVSVAAKVKRNDYWTQVLALYPRVELLKDQLTSAFAQARKLDDVGARKIRIGALFSSTPRNASALDRSRDWRCPYLKCPECGSNGTLYWRKADIIQNAPILRCGCGRTVSDDEFALTRDSIYNRPPDVLFTTTEMLNRSLTSSGQRVIFGIGMRQGKKPYIMLLDEVHTYNGTHGAQVALLIRRWRNLLRSPVHFVGLSATLTDAQGFFADLVGLREGAVRAMRQDTDLESVSREYQVVIKGDPVSAKSLLSTSIQTSMLLARILDPMSGGASDHVYSPKLFAFTDNLDVINRFHFDLTDAEQRQLPLLRRTPEAFSPTTRRRFQEGQIWQICETIGNRLDAAIRPCRVSSQDPGVDNSSKIVLATASLEVGFDDAEVGAVLQHKAPKDPASFLQRKGRAGRRPITRPWTVVVLSDYGRDRYAYQAYEQMFDPVLPRPQLPVRNRYVLRMQAAQALMDWLSLRPVLWANRGSVWYDFARPSTTTSRKTTEIELLRSLLLDDVALADMSQFLASALQLPDSEVRALLWEPPRALMTAVIPTILRRLETNWRKNGVEGTEEANLNVPLPEFISSTLFNELNLPEIQVAVPNDSEPHFMPVAQCLREYAPGRVSKRFGVNVGRAAHWICPGSLDHGDDALDISAFCQQSTDLGTFQHLDNVSNQIQQIKALRPNKISLAVVPNRVSQSSNARLDWRSQVFSENLPALFEVPTGTLAARIVKSVLFYTHNRNSPVIVRRFALGSSATLTISGSEVTKYCRFQDSGTDAAIGFEQEVDGIAFDCAIDADMLDEVMEVGGLRMCRVPYFLSKVARDPELGKLANSFQLGWIGQIYLSLIISKTCVDDLSVENAVRECSQSTGNDFDEVMTSIFQVTEIATDDNPDSDVHTIRGRLHECLIHAFSDQTVIGRLTELAECLYCRPSGDDWTMWLKSRIRATIGGALLRACELTAGQHQASDLLLDIDSGAPDQRYRSQTNATDPIWITEGDLGGCGVVEEILRRYAEDPLRFFLLVEAALENSDTETIDEELSSVLRLTQSNELVAGGIRNSRLAESYENRLAASRQLMNALADNDVLTNRSVITAMNARILKPGSSETTDRLLNDVATEWKCEEDKHSLEIDSRIYAYVASRGHRDGIKQILASIGGDAESSLSHFSLIYSLLWPRGYYLRERVLESYNPYVQLPNSDPRLLRDVFARQLSYIDVDSSDWQHYLDEQLSRSGLVRLRSASKTRLQQCILETLLTPVEIGCIYAYPYVARSGRTENGCFVVLHIREAVC